MEPNNDDFAVTEPAQRSTLSVSMHGERLSRAGKAVDMTQNACRSFRRRFANTPCCACCCPCCDKDDGTPSCTPSCKPFCARFTDSVHDQLSATYDEWAGASAWHEAILLAVGVAVIALLQVIFVETVPSDVRLDSPQPLRRFLSSVFLFNDLMFILLVLAIWRHLVPNVHTRRAVRFSLHLYVMAAARTRQSGRLALPHLPVQARVRRCDPTHAKCVHPNVRAWPMCGRRNTHTA